MSLHKLESDKFAAARLVGKLANICPDLPSDHLTGTSVFKAITGGDPLTTEYKFRDSFEFMPFCRLVFSANYLPRSGDASHAFFRRWQVIPFENTIPPEKQIPQNVLDGQLQTAAELSGLLNRALLALARLQENRGFSKVASVDRAGEDFRATTDPLSVWLDGFTTSDPADLVPRTALRLAYNAAAVGLLDAAESARRQRQTWRDFRRERRGALLWCRHGDTPAAYKRLEQQLRSIIGGTATPEASGGQTVAVVPVLPVVAVATAAGCQSTATR